MGMPQELELRLEFEPNNVEDIKRHPAVAQSSSDSHAETITSVYFDTDDKRLGDACVSLRVRSLGDRHFQTIKTIKPGQLFSRGEWEQEIEGPWPDLGRAKHTALDPLSKQNLAKLLKPVFETRVQRTVHLLHADGSQIEVALDEGVIDTGETKSPLCELELELKDGDPRELFRLARELSDAVPLQLAIKSKPERGYALLDGPDAFPVEKAIGLEIPSTTTLEQAFKTIGRSCLRQLLANRPAMLARKPEAVHQMRIGLRRLRTAISIFKDVVADSKREHIKGELEWITDELGPARDLDVLNAEVLRPLGDVAFDRAGLAAIRKELESRRRQAYSDASRSIKSTRFAHAVLEAAEWIEIGPWASTDDPMLRLRRERSIQAHATAELARRRKKIRKQGKRLRKIDEDLRHKLRIRAKKLRYGIEFFTSVFQGEKSERRRDAALSALKDLQGALGNLSDIAAREKLMSEMADANGKGKDARKVPFVAGVIYGSQQARTDALLEAAESSHAEFSGVKAFWKT
jgi:triphosphatase